MRTNGTTTLDHYLKPILEHRNLITAVTAVTAVIAVAASLVVPPSYRSTASVLLAPISGNPLTPLESDTDVDMATELLISTSKAVVGRVADDLGAQSISLDSDELADNISAASPRDSKVLDLTYRAPTPELAQTIADSFASNYLEYREQIATENRAEAVELLNERIALLKEQLSGIEGQLNQLDSGTQPYVSLSVERDSVDGELQAQQEALAALSTLSLSAGEVLSPARLPVAPTGPGLIALVVGGLAAGLVIGIAAAMLLSAVQASRAPRNRRAADHIEHNRRQEDRFQIGGRRATDRPAESAVERLARVTASREVGGDGEGNSVDLDEVALEATVEATEETDEATAEETSAEETTTEETDEATAEETTDETADETVLETTVEVTDDTTDGASRQATTATDEAGVPATDGATEETTDEPNETTEETRDAATNETAEETTDAATNETTEETVAGVSDGPTPIGADPPAPPPSVEAGADAGAIGSVVHQGTPPVPPAPKRPDRRCNNSSESSILDEERTLERDPEAPLPKLDSSVAAHFGADVPPPPRNKAKLKRDSGSSETHVTVDRRSTGSAGSPRPATPTSSLEVETDFVRLVAEIESHLATGPLACLAVGQHNRAQSIAAGFALVDALKDLDADVLIIDATLDDPVLADLLELREIPGLSELIVGQASMEATIQQLEGFIGLFAMTTGKSTPLARSAFQSTRLREVLRQLKKRFPLTVIIGGDLADAAFLSRTDGELDGLVVATTAPPGEPADPALVEILSALKAPPWVRISVAGGADSTSTATTAKTIA